MVSADLVSVNTANGSTSAVLTSHTIINLPSTARAILPFALLMPGAVSTAPTSAYGELYVCQWRSPHPQRLGSRWRLRHRHRR